MLRLGNVADYRGLRPLETYVPRSHNFEKQVIGLINHLYVRYPVPSFLYPVCHDIDPLDS